VQLIRRLIVDVAVAESWYLESYPDIAEAIRQGVVASVTAHFVQDGYFEGPFFHTAKHNAVSGDNNVHGRFRPIAGYCRGNRSIRGWEAASR
jgi:hypothetical protein